MGRESWVAVAAALVPFTVVALVVYALAWRWLRADPDRGRWLLAWVVAHGLSPLTALAVKYLPATTTPAPHVAAATAAFDLVSISRLVSPWLAALCLFALLLAGVFLWACLLALLDGARVVVNPGVREQAAAAARREVVEIA